MKEELFETEEEMFEALGRDNVIGIDSLQQNLFYLSHYSRLQPVLVKESKVNKGNLVFWYIKALTKKPYMEWQKMKAQRELERKNMESSQDE